MEIAFAEPEDIDKEEWFSDEELALWPPLSREKYVARMLGRIAVKKAAAQYLREEGVAYVSLVVRNDATGVPYLSIGSTVREDIRISLSHESAGAVAVVGRATDPAFGIDIERIRSFDAHLREAFLTPEEERMIQVLPRAEQSRALTLLWSLKEAFLKAAGTGLREHPRELVVRDIAYGKYGIFRDDISVGKGEEISAPVEGRIAVIVHLSA